MAAAPVFHSNFQAAPAYNQGMKRLLLSLAFAAAVFPVAASAQQNPAGPPNPPSAAQRQQFRAKFEQVRKLHEQYRAQVLGALTPAHRQLLAQIAGNLAVASRPDYRAAVAQLDAALSPGEKSAIMAAEQNMRSQMKSMMADMPHPQWTQKNGPPANRGKRKMHQRTAGGILLGVAGGHGMMMGGRGWGPHGGPQGGPPPQQPQ